MNGIRLAGKLQNFADAIHQKGAPLTNCWAFIDGTVRPIARPVYLQKVVFNGHKRVHSLKFQSLVTPDGLIAHMFGPIEGRRHDCALLKLSMLREYLKAHPEFANFVIYGDPAYPISSQFISPFKGARLTAEMAEFNKRMSGCRIAVEWGFSEILRSWTYLDFKRGLKLGLSPVGNLYLVATFLTNCRTCLVGENQISDHFRLSPPTIKEYLQNV